MTQPKSYLTKLSTTQLEEIIPSTTNFERTEKRLKSTFVEYWKALRVLAETVLADKRGTNAINPVFRAKVEDIISKPVDELNKMLVTIETTLLGRGGSGDSFWSCVKQKI